MPSIGRYRYCKGTTMVVRAIKTIGKKLPNFLKKTKLFFKIINSLKKENSTEIVSCTNVLKCLIEISNLMDQIEKENIFKEDNNTNEKPKIVSCNKY